MFRWLRKARRQRRLAPIIKVLPWALTKSFGATDFYSLGQVRRGLKDLNFSAELSPYAFSAYCSPTDAISELKISESERVAYRSELVELFDIPRLDFTIEDVRRMKVRASWNPGKWWHSDWGLYRD